MVEDRDTIDVINYDLTDGTHNTFLAMPRLEEVQLSLSKREEELRTSKLLHYYKPSNWREKAKHYMTVWIKRIWCSFLAQNISWHGTSQWTKWINPFLGDSMLYLLEY